MSSIGIIANPASGKDIRRLVSHATTVDNNEKVNIVERITLAAQAYGVSEIYIMPDTFQIGYIVEDNLKTLGELKAQFKILDMTITGCIDDTVAAAAEMERLQVGCLVVLGGDGTSRAVAKGIRDTPIIALSTGTNNVYPDIIEGTAAGIAAAVIASKRCEADKVQHRDKRVEVYRNGVLLDIALIDAAVSRNIVIGSKAIWKIEDVLMIVATRAHPASIGFSSVAGCKRIVKAKDDFGVCVDLTEKKYKFLAPIAAGVIKTVSMGDERVLKLGEELSYIAQEQGTVALDGEREITFKAGDEIVFMITREGPVRVNIRKALELAHEIGFFTVKE